MMTTIQAEEERRRRELAAFLRARREGLSPESIGLPERHRRRTPGLRRDDVAARAAVSLAWYTNLEQGRPVNPSRAVVTAIADALTLDIADREYLFTLTGHSTPHHDVLPIDRHVLRQFVDTIGAPAYCTDAGADIVAWNEGAVDLFGDFASWEDDERNLLWLLFMEPRFGTKLAERERLSAMVVGSFRYRSEAHRNNPRTIALIERLQQSSPAFLQLWESTTLRRATMGTLAIRQNSKMAHYTTVHFQDGSVTGLRLTAYLQQ